MEREKKIKEMLDLDPMHSTSLISVNKSKKLTLEETEEMVKFEKERHDKLIGQLKGAEARNRYGTHGWLRTGSSVLNLFSIKGPVS
jgi:fructose-1,6-bisphosphatase/sedoheptulose 1,7-bisphosphatase-like protein